MRGLQWYKRAIGARVHLICTIEYSADTKNISCEIRAVDAARPADVSNVGGWTLTSLASLF